MIYDIFLKRVTHLIDIIHMHCLVVWIDLAATLIHWHKYRLYTACGLCHKRCGASRSYGKAGDISTSILHHVGIKFWISFFYSVDKWIVLFSLSVENLKLSTFLSHIDRRAICIESEGLMNQH